MRKVGPSNPKFVHRQVVVMYGERYENKEDAHGGPGYYPYEETIVTNEVIIPIMNVPAVVKMVSKYDKAPSPSTIARAGLG